MVLHVSAFEEQCLTKLNFLVKKVKTLTEDMAELKSNKKGSKAQMVIPPDPESKFPLKNLQALEDFDNRCRDDPNLINICVS